MAMCTFSYAEIKAHQEWVRQLQLRIAAGKQPFSETHRMLAALHEPFDPKKPWKVLARVAVHETTARNRKWDAVVQAQLAAVKGLIWC